MNLLDFDLNVAIQNPERVVFANGEKPSGFCFLKTAPIDKCVFITTQRGDLLIYSRNGLHNSKERDTHYGVLKLIPAVKVHWFCVYKCEKTGLPTISGFYRAKYEFIGQFLGVEILMEYFFEEKL